MSKKLLLPLLAASLAAGVLLPPQPPPVAMQAVHVAGNVWVINSGRGGNIGISAGPDGLLMIDDLFANTVEEVRAALAQKWEQPLQFILNTHWHGDHTGGNAAFGKTAPIVAHDNVRKRMSAAPSGAAGSRPASPPEALPDLTFQESVTVHFNGEAVRVIHLGFPAHTDGDSLVWFPESKVAHMGDLYFQNRFPYVDLASGGSVQGLLESLRKALALLPSGVRLIPGHGEVTGKDGLEQYLTALEESVAIVTKRAADGMALAAIQEQGLPANFEGWSWQFIDTGKWIELVYRSMFPDGR